MHDDTHDPLRIIKLRLLAEAALTTLSGETAAASTSQRSIAADASAEQLLAVLKRAVPVLRASIHQQLADQIEAVLTEGA